MRKELWLFAGVALVIGILGGVLITNKVKSPAPAGSNSAPPNASLPAVNAQQQITTLEGIVAKDPSNRNAWVQLGNTYFDSQQPMKSVNAYSKALELDGNDPDVLTDQGVMFRQLGWYDRAIENFLKANKIQPSHSQSLYNMGFVYYYDLKDPSKALAAWKKYLEVSPNGPGADKVRSEIEMLKTQQGVSSGKAQGMK